MLYWIWLTQIGGIGPVCQRVLLKKFKQPELIYHARLEDILLCEGFGPEKAKKIVGARSLESAKKVLDDTSKLNIKLLTLYDSLYPEKVKIIPETPILLYYKGILIKDSMGVAIVGARRCSEYGKLVTTSAATFLAHQGVSVISGMAKGIDSYAHTVCLKEGGYTIAVLGNGPDICYPSEHKGLMERIIDNGAVISEYGPGISPKKEYFPKRNGLISAWAHKVLVVEAGLNSGSLITADFATKWKRELLAVPGSIYSKESLGCNDLLFKGAKIYLKEQQLLPDDYVNQIRPNKKQETHLITMATKLTELESRILHVLVGEGKKTVQELGHILVLDKMEILESVSVMELKCMLEVSGDCVRVPCESVPDTMKILV